MSLVVTARRLATTGLGVAAALLVVSVLSDQSHARETQAPCYVAVPYPGDSASRVQLARWMGAAARAAGLPPELPVMAALVDSGLRNRPPASGSDSVGFFQMRTAIWNRGEYAGYPARPQLQVKWFLDSAIAVKVQRYAGRGADVGRDPTSWGGWIADVERPAEQLRGRYQLRLEEARTLLKTS